MSGMWTRRHYEAIAAYIKQRNIDIDKKTLAKRVVDRSELMIFTYALIEMFQADNSRFDKQRFFIACGWRDTIGNDN